MLDNTHTHNHQTYITFVSSCALTSFNSLSQLHHVTASLPSPGDNHRAREGGPKEHRAKQNGGVKFIQLHIHQASPLFHFLHEASAVIPLLPKASFTPFISLTSVYLVLDLHLLPPSTPFWPYGSHPFFPHAQIISILSDQPNLGLPRTRPTLTSAIKTLVHRSKSK